MRGKAKGAGLMNLDYIFVMEFESCVGGLGHCSVGDMWYTFDDEDWLAVKGVTNENPSLNSKTIPREG